MAFAFYVFVAVALLMLWYRILRGLWDASTRARWAAKMRRTWDQVK